MAYHSFPWRVDAWVALDIHTPSPQRDGYKIFFSFQQFPIVFDFSEIYNPIEEHQFLLFSGKDGITRC